MRGRWRGGSWALALVTMGGLAHPAQAAPTGWTLEAALRAAMVHNPELAAEGMDLAQALLEVRRAQDRQAPVMAVESGLNRTARPSGSVFLSGTSQIQETRQNYDLSLRQPLVTGGSLSLGFNNGIADTNSTKVDLNPAYVPKISVSYRQPLLRQAWEPARQERAAEIQARKAALQLRDRRMRLVTETAGAYWDLYAARESVALLARSREASRELLAANRAKEASGFLARIDVIQAEASLAATETELLEAQRRLANAEDRLRRLILPAEAPASWQEPLELTDVPRYLPRPRDAAGSRSLALARQFDVLAAQLDEAARELELESARQERLPQLQFEVSTGIEELSNQYAQAVGNLASGQNSYVSAGLSLELPLTRSSLEDAVMKAELARQQARLRAQAARMTLEIQLRQALRHLDSGARRLEAAESSQRLAQAQLEAETQKLALGLSTNFQVIMYQKARDEASLRAISTVVELVTAELELQRLEGTLLELALGERDS